ncbi:MAG: hypothetical protein U5R30_14985 [Deltaproteobacteria bacterium]|nr:hypothetical protein [Deltaproteobacteria bacterium]
MGVLPLLLGPLMKVSHAPFMHTSLGTTSVLELARSRILQPGGFERVMVCVRDLRQYDGVPQLPGKGVTGQEFIDHAAGIVHPLNALIATIFFSFSARVQ